MTDPASGSGILISAPATLLNPALATIAVEIGAQSAAVQFPGLVAPGLYQFNLVIPQLPDGDATLVATIGGISTLADRVIAVQH